MPELKTIVVISLYFGFVFIFNTASAVHNKKTYYFEGLLELSVQNRFFLFGNILTLETDDLLDP